MPVRTCAKSRQTGVYCIAATQSGPYMETPSAPVCRNRSGELSKPSVKQSERRRSQPQIGGAVGRVAPGLGSPQISGASMGARVDMDLLAKQNAASEAASSIART
eukprot:7259546-Prymnesium_polylepis.3